jgi:hypothetical protein
MRLRLLLCVAAFAFVSPRLQAQSSALTAWQAPYGSYCGYQSPFMHKSPATKKMLIDDWLGFGYMRYSVPSHGWAGNQNSVYAPRWPGLFSCHCPLWFPFRPLFCLLPPVTGRPYNGWYAGGGYNPYYGQPSAGQWAPQYGPPACAPNPCAPPVCCPQPVCPPPPVCPPVAVRVPVTICRPVTVDAGYYQQVWVSRPQTVMVPETRWQTRYVQPGQNWMPQQQTIAPGCTGPDCTPGIPGGMMAPTPDAAFLPQPTMSGIQQSTTYYSAPQPAGQTIPPVATRGMPSGDIYGDHESAVPTRTGQLQVAPNSWQGGVPLVRTSYMNRYPSTPQPQRRYPSSVR